MTFDPGGTPVYDDAAKCLCNPKLWDPASVCCPRHAPPGIVEFHRKQEQPKKLSFSWPPGVAFMWGWKTVSITLQLEFKWGRDDMWYDGPHNSFWVGPVCIYWNW